MLYYSSSLCAAIDIGHYSQISTLIHLCVWFGDIFYEVIDYLTTATVHY